MATHRHPLDNVFWQSLSGPHANLSDGDDRARRYRAGFSPIAAFADPHEPDLASLATRSQPGEAFYVAAWDGPHPASDWVVEFDGRMVAMTWNGVAPPPPIHIPCLDLCPEHLGAMLDLVERTQPGPFGPRNLEMGSFIGHFAPDGSLIAMAGERTRAGEWHEVSAICTHPDHQGLGLGRQLTHEVVRRMLLRGEKPYLHVRADNTVARLMYRRLGFREVLETPIRVIRRL